MEKSTFVSKEFPSMNLFWSYLEDVLKNLPENPKPECLGFYFAYYNPKNKKLVAEKIGIVPKEKEFKYLHISCKKVTQTILFGELRSKDFENDSLEQCPGAFAYTTNDGDHCTGTSGHDSMIDEAISVLWLIGKIIKEKGFTSKENYFGIIRDEAIATQKLFTPDNKWVTIIAQLMLERRYLNFT